MTNHLHALINYFYAHCDTCNTTLDVNIAPMDIDFILETAIDDGDALHHLATNPRYVIEDHYCYFPDSVITFIGAHNHHHVTFTSPTYPGIFTCQLGDDDTVKEERAK